MKKSLLFLSLILTINLILPLLPAQAPFPDFPKIAGEIDEKTGLPQKFSDFKEAGDKLSAEEEKEKYLKQQWTKLAAKNKISGPFLFYTDKGFSFFNPFWKVIFGTEFSWSWAFIFSIIIWILIIIFIYSPVKSFTKFNPILTLIASILIASILGIMGVIPEAVNVLTLIVTNLWIVITSIIVIFLIAITYNRLMDKYGKGFKEKHEKFKEKMNRQSLERDTKTAKEFAKAVSGR